MSVPVNYRIEQFQASIGDKLSIPVGVSGHVPSPFSLRTFRTELVVTRC
jgi:hypothetical protein